MNNKYKLCPNCSQAYVLTTTTPPLKSRRPLNLQCGHSICEVCIVNITKFAEPYDCKICDKTTEISPDDAKLLLENVPMSIHKHFPINLYLLGEVSSHLWINQPDSVQSNDNYVDLKYILRTTDCTVGSCVECKVPSSVMCQQCQTVLCDVCFEKIHTIFESFKSHVMQNIGMKLGPNNCEVHKDKMADYYCSVCSKAICIDCMMIGNEKSCKNHSVVSVQQKNIEFLDELSTIRPKVDETFRRLTRSAVDIGNILEKSNTKSPDQEINKLIKNVCTEFSKLHAVLQNQESEVLSKIEKIKLGDQSSLREMKKELEENIKLSKTTLNKIDKVLTEGNPKVILSGLLDSAKNVLDIPWFLSKREDNNSTIKFDVDENVYEVIKDSIKFECDSNVGYKLLASKYIGSDVEVPPAPENAVFPPEFVRDVRELYKPKQQEKANETPIMQAPKAPIMQAPKYRVKSASSSSSINSVGLDSVTNKSPQSFREDGNVQAMSSFDAVNHDLHEGDQEMIFISHIGDPHNIFVQRAKHQSLVKELIREFRRSGSSPQPSLKSIQEGKILLVYNAADKQWQRCRVVKIDRKDASEPKFQVYCIDFGNTEYVGIDKLRLLSTARVYSPPPLTFHCSLANCAPVSYSWTSEDTLLIQKIIDNKQALIHVWHVNSTNHGTVLECDIITLEDSVNLTQALVFHGRARLRDHKLTASIQFTALDDKPKLFWNSNDFTVGSVEDVQITHVINPDKFYIRKCYHQDAFEKLSEDLNNTYNFRVMTGSVFCPTKDMVCVVNVDKYSEQVRGSGWRRAIIRDPQGRGRVRVVLVDTGEVATVHWSTLRHIKQQFTKLKALSVECHLSGVTPLNKRWSEGSLALMASYQSSVLEARVEEAGLTRDSLGVLLYCNSEGGRECVNTEMIRHKFAISIGTVLFDQSKLKELPVCTRDLLAEKKGARLNKKKKITIMKKESLVKDVNEQDSKAKKAFVKKVDDRDYLEAKDKGPLKIEVNILSCKSPSLLYVSLTDQQKTFKEFFESIQTYYSKNKTSAKMQWNVGDKCCTICAESKTWRRATILEIADELAEVFYIDFACVEKVPIGKLRELPEELLKTGAAAIMCHLSGIVPAGDKTWPSLTIEYLKELIDAYQRFFITKNGIIKDMSIPIELWVYHITQGGALEPDKAEWRCLNKKIIEQGLAVPDKQNTNSNNSEKTTDADDLISFLSVTGSIKDWLQVETVSDEPAFDVSAALSSSSSTSNGNSTVVSKRSVKPLTSQTDQQKSSSSKKRNDVQTIMISDWPPPEPLSSPEFCGIPTYIDNDGVIYLHDMCQQDTLDVIRNALDQRFKDSVAKPSDSYWSVGQPCIARFYLDEKFYRCRVKAVNDEERTCFVHYVDYGNEEMCSVSNMRKNLVLWQMPVQAHKCILGCVKPACGQWDKNALDYIHKMIVEKNCLIKVTGDKIGDTIPIDIKVGMISLSDHLVELDMAEFIDGSPSTWAVSQSLSNVDTHDNKNDSMIHDADSGPDYIVEDDNALSDQLNDTKSTIGSISLGHVDWNKLIEEDEQRPTDSIPMYSKLDIGSDNFVCTVSAIANDQFELLVKTDDDRVAMQEKLHKEIQEAAPELPPVDGIYEKKACIALFNDDNEWYRASILQYSEEKQIIKVKFVDFGDTAVVDISEVREALEKWTEMPAASVSAKLYGISLNSEVDYDVEEFDATFLDKEFNTTIIERDVDYIYVEFRDEANGPLAYQNLIDKKVLKLVSDD